LRESAANTVRHEAHATTTWYVVAVSSGLRCSVRERSRPQERQWAETDFF